MLPLINKIKVFLLEDIWRMRKDEITKSRFWLIRFLRISSLAIRRFIIDQGPTKASALTFFSLLSVVPIAAMAFGIAKGFGFRETLEEELQKRLIGHEEVVKWIQDFALEYLDNTKGGMIAGISLVVVLFAVMRLMNGIEESFNDIWDVKRSRSFIRKFSDYVSMMMVAIVLLATSGGLVVFVANSLRDIQVVSFASSILMWVAPYLMMWLVFSLLFMIMPNTKVKPISAVFGGIIAGTLFLATQYGYIYFQVGVSRYNAIYGSFAALPLFLIWMQASWMIVLFGAELAFAHQNEKSFEFEVDTRNMSVYTHKLVSILIVREVVKEFEKGKAHLSVSEIAERLRLPIRLVTDLVYSLFEAGILAEVDNDSKDDIILLPAYDINKMNVVDVMHRIEHTGYSETILEKTDEANLVRKKIDHYEQVLSGLPENQLLKDL
ncbi:YhjD/YihY/BrkB family envelope integrity protein [Marinilabilia rubra]|uniref:YihY/virulence factor BrkB family protein n=1 Tax=Marinilabilia rubra TaxID=2162893 RepID=A0A2U2BCF1_9BACT|nr:YhjD/YihY/BrkB family envelope integrity protein [Marinilabilia rubra]PWE00740.1 YihY/virulence factor BrkB family protein [Marinilabilia rubra]